MNFDRYIILRRVLDQRCDGGLERKQAMLVHLIFITRNFYIGRILHGYVNYIFTGRYRPGTRALMEIRHYQKTTHLLLRTSPFVRVVSNCLIFLLQFRSNFIHAENYVKT